MNSSDGIPTQSDLDIENNGNGFGHHYIQSAHGALVQIDESPEANLILSEDESAVDSLLSIKKKISHFFPRKKKGLKKTKKK
ncbi:MAG: hypothetical protein WCW87_02005 [Candidatus Paceibacterota bacterium]